MSLKGENTVALVGKVRIAQSVLASSSGQRQLGRPTKRIVSPVRRVLLALSTSPLDWRQPTDAKHILVSRPLQKSFNFAKSNCEPLSVTIS